MKILKKIPQIKFQLIAMQSKISHMLLISTKYFLVQLISLFTLRQEGNVKVINAITPIKVHKSKPISRINDLKVVCIMDTFTYNIFEPEADFYQLSLDNWFNQIKEVKPNILFVESAWRGSDGKWEDKINNVSQEVIDIIALCQKMNIITMFWNKEDPVHFETFINTAKYFDYIFTTDKNCIPQYKQRVNHDNVYLLPFSVQPKLHNPIEIYSRKNAISFAGAYYWKFKRRNAIFENFIKHLMINYKIDIYDRNYNNPTSVHQFPKEYKPFIRGTLLYSEIDKAYKGYEYSINLNSINNSSTMFSRRVFELIASNTLVISNYSNGLKLLFGDLVISTDSGKKLLKILFEYNKDHIFKRKIKLLALRKVLIEHTVEDRWQYVINKMPIELPKKELPCVTILSYIKSDMELKDILKTFNRQSYKNIDMIVIYSKEMTIVSNKYKHIKFIADISIDSLYSSLKDKKGYVSIISHNDYYGENYILDLILAKKYSNAHIIGKSTYYKVDNNHQLSVQNNNCEYKYVNTIKSTMCIIENSTFMKLNQLHKLSINSIVLSSTYKESILSIDSFNYCENGSKFILNENNIKIVNDLIDINIGVSLNTILDGDNE